MTIAYEIKELTDDGMYVVVTNQDGTTFGLSVPKSKMTDTASVDSFVLENTNQQVAQQVAVFTVGESRQLAPTAP